MSDETSEQTGKGEATFAPGQDILDTPSEDLKRVEEYLLWLEKGVEFSHGILYQIVTKIADFHHDQTLAHLRLADSLAELLPDPDPEADEAPPDDD
mgnify:CR=1 FL=1